MKTSILKQLTLLFLLTISITSMAQQKPKKHIPREQMAEAQAKNIANELKLGNDVYNKFIKTYKSYRKELWSTVPKHGKHKRPSDKDTEEQAARRMKEQFDRSQKILDIRNKYYVEFSKFLTQKQIESMYEQERKIMQRLKERQKKHRSHREGHNDGK